MTIAGKRVVMTGTSNGLGRAKLDQAWLWARMLLRISPTMGVYAATKNAVRTISEALRRSQVRICAGRNFSRDPLTGFFNSMTHRMMKEVIATRTEEAAIAADAMANAIAFAINQPHHVYVSSR